MSVTATHTYQTNRRPDQVQNDHLGHASRALAVSPVRNPSCAALMAFSDALEVAGSATAARPKVMEPALAVESTESAVV